MNKRIHQPELDLFGEPLRPMPKDNTMKFVATTVTRTELWAIEGWAEKFGMSRAKFVRYLIQQSLRDLPILMS